MKSPFQNQINSDYINSPHVIIRWEKTRAFLNNYNAKRGLDIGDRTPFSDQLESFFNCPFENTTFDLDEGKLEGEYDIVTAFEIIEHLFNPLHLLTEIAGILKDIPNLVKPGGSATELWKTIDARTREHPYLEKDGLVHHGGHGVGLRPHEAPDLNRDREGIFEVGDVFSCEPGGYGDAMRVGVRLENTFLIKADGVENLSEFPLNLIPEKS